MDVLVAKARWACYCERYNVGHKKNKRASLEVILSRTKTRTELARKLLKERINKSQAKEDKRKREETEFKKNYMRAGAEDEQHCRLQKEKPKKKQDGF